MAQMQEKLQPVDAWTTFLGCTAACSNYLGYQYSPAWIFGVTGGAFIMNIHPDLCPSGPTAFDNSFLKANAEALGLHFDGVNAWKGAGDCTQSQKAAHDFAGKAIEKDIPCFGWELGIPEYYLICGTDAKGYLYRDFDRQIKHCAWDSLGISDIGMLEMNSVSRKEFTPSLEKQARAALEFLQVYHADPASFALPGYTQGLQAYDVWINAMRDGKPDMWGLPYNAAVWSEARAYALGFLRELKEGLKGKDLSLLNKAIGSFTTVSGALKKVSALYPFPPQQEQLPPDSAGKAASLLIQARDAETEGIRYLLEFAGQL
jgi:hypothetical protein